MFLPVEKRDRHFTIVLKLNNGLPLAGRAIALAPQ